jgi:hypothetical protein
MGAPWVYIETSTKVLSLLTPLKRLLPNISIIQDSLNIRQRDLSSFPKNLTIPLPLGDVHLSRLLRSCLARPEPCCQQLQNQSHHIPRNTYWNAMQPSRQPCHCKLENCKWIALRVFSEAVACTRICYLGIWAALVVHLIVGLFAEWYRFCVTAVFSQVMRKSKRSQGGGSVVIEEQGFRISNR